MLFQNFATSSLSSHGKKTVSLKRSINCLVKCKKNKKYCFTPKEKISRKFESWSGLDAAGWQQLVNTKCTSPTKKKEGELFETVSSYLCQYYTILWVKFPKTMFALFQNILSHHNIVRYKPLICNELWLKQAWKHHQQTKEQVQVV